MGKIKDAKGNTIARVPIFMVRLFNGYIHIQDGEDVKGKLMITMLKGKRLDHLGIRVELIGVIEFIADKNASNVQFLSMARDLEAPGALSDTISYDFTFSRVEKPYESYN